MERTNPAAVIPFRRQVLRRAEEFAAVQAQWAARILHPEALPEFIAAVCRSDAAVVRPHVVLLWQGEDLAGIAVARIERLRFPVQLGYITLRNPQLSTVRLSYRGVYGADTPAVMDQLYEGLWEPVASGEADALAWDEVPTGDALEPWTGRIPPRAMRDAVLPQRSIHWLIDLPDSYEALHASFGRSTRHSLKQRSRAIEKAFPGRVSVACYRDMADFDRIVADTEAVAKGCYQRALGVGYLNDLRAKSLVIAGLESGTFRGYLLYLDGEPAAYWHILDWAGARYACATGYRSDRVDGLGGYLLQAVMRDACSDPSTRLFDFGFGHAEYKRRIATRSFEEYARCTFARRPKPWAINFARGVADRVELGGDWLLVKLGLRQGVKARWRRYLIEHGRQKDDPQPT